MEAFNLKRRCLFASTFMEDVGGGRLTKSILEPANYSRLLRGKENRRHFGEVFALMPKNTVRGYCLRVALAARALDRKD